MEKQIDNKNKEIEALNLKVQKMEGFHKREVGKLEDEIAELKNKHQTWLDTQTRESEEWAKEKTRLQDEYYKMEQNYKKQVDATNDLENRLRKEIEKRNLEIADLKGKIQ